jgi:hypothetical protein
MANPAAAAWGITTNGDETDGSDHVEDDDEQSQVDNVQRWSWEQLAHAGSQRGLTRVTGVSDNGTRTVEYSRYMDREGTAAEAILDVDIEPRSDATFELLFVISDYPDIRTCLVTMKNPSVWTLLFSKFGSFRTAMTLSNIWPIRTAILTEILRVHLLTFVSEPPDCSKTISPGLLDIIGPTRFGQLHMLLAAGTDTLLNITTECKLPATSCVVLVNPLPAEIRSALDVMTAEIKAYGENQSM